MCRMELQTKQEKISQTAPQLSKTQKNGRTTNGANTHSSSHTSKKQPKQRAKSENEVIRTFQTNQRQHVIVSFLPKRRR